MRKLSLKMKDLTDIDSILSGNEVTCIVRIVNAKRISKNGELIFALCISDDKNVYDNVIVNRDSHAMFRYLDYGCVINVGNCMAENFGANG